MEVWEYQNIQSKIQEESDARICRAIENANRAPSTSDDGIPPQVLLIIAIFIGVIGLIGLPLQVGLSVVCVYLELGDASYVISCIPALAISVIIAVAIIAKLARRHR